MTLVAPATEGTIRYTTDGSPPTTDSPRYDGKLELRQTTTVKARIFQPSGRSSLASDRTFTYVPPREWQGHTYLPGLTFRYYEGTWVLVPDYEELRPIFGGIVDALTLEPRRRADFYGFTYEGYVDIESPGEYKFYLRSDDGAKLYLDEQEVANTDGLHPVMENASEPIELSTGLHAIRVDFFENRGNDALEVLIEGPGIQKRSLTPEILYHRR